MFICYEVERALVCCVLRMFAVDEPRWRNEVNAVTQQEVEYARMF